MNKANVQRNYKDTVFRMLFKEKENLLSLYNAVNGTAYTDVNKLEITTLENAVYMNYKNDISFVFDFRLMIYEHQSTANPNMPLRDLIYVVFYNGVDFQPERQTLRLSDAYEKEQEKPELELTVSVYNINLGHNTALLGACRLLKEYAQYVDYVRVLAKEMPFPDAVESAVDYCIKNGVLEDFLSKNRAEAISVSIFEYDEEKHMKSEREEWRSIGRKEGIEKGQDKLAKLLQKLIDDDRGEEVGRVLTDHEYREKLYQENNINI